METESKVQVRDSGLGHVGDCRKPFDTTLAPNAVQQVLSSPRWLGFRFRVWV